MMMALKKFFFHIILSLFPFASKKKNHIKNSEKMKESLFLSHSVYILSTYIYLYKRNLVHIVVSFVCIYNAQNNNQTGRVGILNV